MTDGDASGRPARADGKTVPGRADAAPRPTAARADSMRNTAYERIKSAIIKAQYRGGQFLNVAALAKDMNMGRTPIHEAIMRLDQEDLVDVMPRKGVIVRSATLSEARDIAAIRALNEAQCAAWAAERIERQGIERLGAILQEAGEAIRARDVEKALLLDRRFHECISDIAGNRILAGILSNLHERSHRYWYLSFSSVPHMEKVQSQHQAIFEAIRDQDAKRASRAARRHVEKFLENVSNLF
ncbi:MAG: GntR family transcriptional regulator [Rhodobacteraceae bacterium]|nr:GntR family transcriptional regulator [Paracoccaceae bacterium]